MICRVIGRSYPTKTNMFERLPKSIKFSENIESIIFSLYEPRRGGPIPPTRKSRKMQLINLFWDILAKCEFTILLEPGTDPQLSPSLFFFSSRFWRKWPFSNWKQKVISNMNLATLESMLNNELSHLESVVATALNELWFCDFL